MVDGQVVLYGIAPINYSTYVSPPLPCNLLAFIIGCLTISDTLTVRNRKFLYRYAQSDNVLCKVFAVQP